MVSQLQPGVVPSQRHATLFRDEAHRRAGTWLMANQWMLYSGMACTLSHFPRYYDLDLHLEDWRIGLLMAIPLLCGALFQPVWGMISDRWLGRTNAYRLVQGLTGLFFLAYSFSYQLGGFGLLFVSACALMTCYSSNSPLSSGLIMSLLGPGRRHLFGRIRVFGSMSFTVTIFLLCPLMVSVSNWLGVYPREGIFWLGALFYALGVACARWDEAQFQPHHRPPMRSFVALVKNRNLLHLYFALFCLGFGAASGIQYIGPYIGLRGHSEFFFGSLWMVGVSVEIVLTWYLHQIVHAFGLKRVFVFGLLSEGMRWIIVSMTTNPLVYLLAFLLHGPSTIGAFFVSAMYLDSECEERTRSTAQTLLYFSIVLGQITGYLGSSQLIGLMHGIARVDAIHQCFFYFGCVAVFASLYAAIFLRKEHPGAV
ncbi:MAG: MFS transporter [bacterium]|nr:MFS transporter [bacterium]